MRVSISARGVDCDDELREFANRRAAFAFSRFGEEVREVDLKLEDVNGPRGGIDQRCKLIVRLRRAPDPIVSEATETEIRPAIESAASRASRSVARTLDQMTDRRNRPTIR